MIFSSYGGGVTFGPYPISGGDLSITITDDTDPTCTTTITVVTPTTCSDECDISSLCPCEDVAMILDGDIDGGAYLTSITIVSAGRVSTGSTVYFQAEDLITLIPGFTAEVGSAFSARIEECGSTDPLPLLPEEQEGGEDEGNDVASRTTPPIEPSVEYDGDWLPAYGPTRLRECFSYRWTCRNQPR